MTRRRQRKSYIPKSRWFVVERWLHCAVGSHDVPVGSWARWTVRRDGTADCADCLLERYGIVRPVGDLRAEALPVGDR